MILEYSQADILRNVVLPPSMYRVHIDKVVEAMSAAGTSVNIRIEGTVMCDANTGDTGTTEKPIEGVPTPFLWTYNSKAPGMMNELWAAVGEGITAAGQKRDTQALQGKTLEISIANELYKGKMVNAMGGSFAKDRRAGQ